MLFPLWPQILSNYNFKPIFGQITILSFSFVTFRVSRFHVSYLTHKTFKLHLQNTLNMSETAKVYFGVLQVVNGHPGFGASQNPYLPELSKLHKIGVHA